MQNSLKTLMSGFKTFIDKKFRSSVADWNQNDTSADNYIKNRTHWEEENFILVKVVPKITVTIDSNGGYAALPSCPKLTVGKTYTVILNGIEYQCVARQYDAVLLGNGTIYGDGDESNGEPFSIDSYDNEDIYLRVATAGKYTVSISYSENKVTVHQLDEKYLPDSIVKGVDELTTDLNETRETANEALSTATQNAESLITFDEGTMGIDGYLLTGASSIIYGNGMYMLVYRGGIYYSQDTIHWNRAYTLSSYLSNVSAVYSDGKFVVATSSSNKSKQVTVFTSTDGINWSPKYIKVSSTSIYIDDVRLVYFNGKFILTTNKVILSSTDGINWSSYSSLTLPCPSNSVLSQIRSFDIVDDRIMASYDVRDSKTTTVVAYSSDGTTWTLGEFLAPCDTDSTYIIYYKNGRYLAFDDMSLKVYYSADLKNWTQATFENGFIPEKLSQTTWNCKRCGNYYIIYHQSLNVVYYSSSGVSWQKTEVPLRNINVSGYGNGIYILAGTSIDYSGSDKRAVGIVTSTNWKNWVYKNNAFVKDGIDITEKISDFVFTNSQLKGNFSLNQKANTLAGRYSVIIGEELEAPGSNMMSVGRYNSIPQDCIYSYEASKTLYAPNVVSYSLGYTVDAEGRMHLTEPIMDAKETGFQLPCYTKYCDVNSLENSSVNIKSEYAVLRVDKVYTDPTTSNIGLQGRLLTTVQVGDYMDTQYAYILGNGESDTSRSNAHTVQWDGTAWYSGDVYVGSTSGVNKDEGSKKLATEEYVVEQPKPYVYLTDSVNGKTYKLEMQDGILVSSLHTEGDA